MHILVVSLNHKIAPVHIREQMTFNDEELKEAVTKLRQSKSILECVIVTTCNRTEVYVVCDQLHTGKYYTKAFLAEWFSLEIDIFEPYLMIRESEATVEHLFRVACGLDSMILGETQILGQVRDYFLLAQKEGTTGTIFNELFKQAITIAKRAHSETGIDESPVSVSYAAVQLAQTIFGNLENKHVLILGAGETSELTARNLQSNGVQDITVINRTLKNAERLSAHLNGEARPFSELQVALTECDILISSTASKNFVITNELVQSMIHKRKGRPLFLIDIAVPRDLDPDLGNIEGVFLYNIDDLQSIVAENLEGREKLTKEIVPMIADGIHEFELWIHTLGVVPLITALRAKALAIQSRTMESIENKLPDLTEREKKVLRKHTKSIVNQLLRDPILGIKEMAAEDKADEAMDTFIEIFAIEDELSKVDMKPQISFDQSNKKIDKQQARSLTSLNELPLRS